ncbi:MAG TPA: hypothetical protein PK443_03500, partial [bacterium]|nr:hypothetical protein [bacterium]
KDHDDNEAYSNTVGNAFLDSINDGLYVAGREAVDTRFWSSGLEDTGNYLFTYDNNGAAALVVNRELLGSGSGLDNRHGLPMNNGLSFYDANIDEIRTGSIYGAATGAAVFGGVVFAPTIASLATSAYYATSTGVVTVATVANNTYYKAGAAVERLSYDYPMAVKGLYLAKEFSEGYFLNESPEPPDSFSETAGLWTRKIIDEGYLDYYLNYYSGK